jgi:hypothetical protein
MKKLANELNRAFSKEEVKMAKKHMKKYSTSLAMKKCIEEVRRNSKKTATIKTIDH